ncbi:MAG: 1,4-alpha-glucan branching protein GlgB [Clostridiales Family XIII bacterium]|jgi:1,4-alpha-glucan branching enzyme|nr:1,4-alpha-glucan branching protein GlgB [Clostridiales Family XIII bacterium]
MNSDIKPAEICRRYDETIDLFYAGESTRAHTFFGCHLVPDARAHLFAVWAPNAEFVRVVGDFNGWDTEAHPMEVYRGIWVALIPDLFDGAHYKYYIKGADGCAAYKADPFAFYCEAPPGTASRIWSLDGYAWHDERYARRRGRTNILKEPVSVYELHIGSWRGRKDGGYPSYRTVADELAEYASDMGYTHVELMPINEYPYDGSWGYQVTGFFAVTSRFGTPQDFMYFVDTLHSAGIGVIVDWVPAHFPKDAHGLARFDGTWLYEHKNPARREHPQWGTHIFNYSRPEVRSFLLSAAALLLDRYRLDGLRVDAVSSMLYLDYGREGDFIPNRDGGNIDYEAVEFMRRFNTALLTEFPGCFTVAEESTSFPLVTRPPYDGGLGFTFKWNMGFMNDTLDYMRTDPYFRGGSHEKMTFSMHYAFSENFILPYSHDEVVHGKASMIGKMYGEYAEKFASLRTLYAYMFAHPGKKLMFMGDEFAQFIEWDYQKALDWLLLDFEAHAGMRDFVRALNGCYRRRNAFFGSDTGWDGFTWLNVEDRENSVFAFLRSSGKSKVVCVFNFTPVRRDGYVVALPEPGVLSLLLNSDATVYGGAGTPLRSRVRSERVRINGFAQGASLTLPPLSALYYSFTGKPDEKRKAR